MNGLKRPDLSLCRHRSARRGWALHPQGHFRIGNGLGILLGARSPHVRGGDPAVSPFRSGLLRSSRCC